MSRPFDPTLPSAPGADTQVHAEEAYCSACNQSYPAETKVCPKDGARLIKLAAEHDKLIGKQLDERYEIRAPLGKGGMGTVYRGWQLSVDREVAIKVIHHKLADDRSAVKRFLREARLASRLSQPNIVNVYDFGQSDGVLYLVMELLRGHTLSAELGQGRRINPKRTVVIAAQLCDALEAAHAQGIVHRDLKPSNIVILDDPPGRDLIKVLDFGLAKSLTHDSGSIVTNTDQMLGTPLYMAPEQIEGNVSDQRADLYSLGCILYEMLTGKPPFVDAAVSAVLARHVSETPVPLPAHVPAKLRALVEALLAKTPEARIQTAGEVRRILEDVREAPGYGGPTPVAINIPDAPDTIPDIAPGLAETHAATPTPVGMLVSRAEPQSLITGGAKPRRYAIVALFAIVSLAVVAFVAFQSLNKSESPGRGDRLNTDNPNDQGSGPSTQQQHVVPPNALPDAGVAGVAEPVIAIDAGVVRRTTGSERLRPRIKPDAGVAAEPDIDFLPSKKP